MPISLQSLQTPNKEIERIDMEINDRKQKNNTIKEFLITTMSIQRHHSTNPNQA